MEERKMGQPFKLLNSLVPCYVKVLLILGRVFAIVRWKLGSMYRIPTDLVDSDTLFVAFRRAIGLIEYDAHIADVPVIEIVYLRFYPPTAGAYSKE